MNEYDKRDDRIIYAQAMNLAVDYLAIIKDQFKTPEDRTDAVLQLREFFYKELCKTPPRTEAFEKGTQAPAARPKRTYKSEKQEIFLRSQDEVTGEFETPATVDMAFGPGTGPRGGQFEG